MIRRLVLAVLLVSAVSARAEQSPEGLWLTQDHDGIIAVMPCGNAICARIDGVILDHPGDPTPLDYRGVSQCHLPLITDAKRIEPGLWKGHIVDPRNGSVYGVELRTDRNGVLGLRGFLGIPLLGHTQYWTRYTGTVPADCRLQVAPGANTDKPPNWAGG